MAEIVVDKNGSVYRKGANDGWEPRGLQDDQTVQPQIERPGELPAPTTPPILEAPVQQPVLPEPAIPAQITSSDAPSDLKPFVRAQPATYMVGPDGTVVTPHEAVGIPFADLTTSKGTPQ